MEIYYFIKRKLEEKKKKEIEKDKENTLND